MVLLKLRGSLGNQLFQYCFARSISLENSTKLLIDWKSIYKYKSQSYYSLNRYNIDALHLPFSTRYLPFRFFNKIGIGINVIREDHTKFFSSNILNSPLLQSSRVLLDGHWMSYKYFEKNWDRLESEIALKDMSFDEYQQKTLYNLKNENSVFIHVRRGDYVNSKLHYNLPESYYHEAIRVISSEVKSPRFFVFSDDIEWASNSFLSKYNCAFLNQNVLHPEKDLFLMSQAKHSIIANSSFSWWGAWLNQSSEKIVISPRKWFLNDPRNLQVVDLIPSKWRVI